MADKRSDNPGGKPQGQPATLLCAEFEAQLVDALDGTLSHKEAAAFEAHRATCSACAQLLLEAKRGSEWLHLLEAEPEVPSDLVARILARTSSAIDTMPQEVAIAGIPMAVAQPGWLPGLERHAVQSRWLMTAAMAFFSIAFTLNLTGVRLTGLRLSDLKPAALASSLTRQFYVADAHVMRYYDNLRFVYELESRVREMKRDAAPAATQQNATPQPKQQKKPGDGSAQKTVPGTPSAPPVDEQLREPVMASFHPDSLKRSSPCSVKEHSSEEVDVRAQLIALEQAPRRIEVCDSNTKGTKIDRAEGSLA